MSRLCRVKGITTLLKRNAWMTSREEGGRHDLGRTWNEMKFWAALNDFQPELRLKLLLFPQLHGNKCSGKWKVDNICKTHLLLPLCEVLTLVSYLRVQSLLVLCAGLMPLGTKVRCQAAQQRNAEFNEKLVNNIIIRLQCTQVFLLKIWD